MKHILSKTIAVTAIIFACNATNSKVNAMMPNPSILAETAAYLTEIAPEIAAGVGAAVIMARDAFDDGSRTGYPMPEMEQVRQDSNGKDTTLFESALDAAADARGRRAKDSDGCDIF